jgi:phosphinothricin acetyltransferase
MIRAARAGDAARICAIYNHYIESTVVTFEEEPVEPAEIASRMADVTANLPWLVYERDGALAGYAYASTWHKRSAYRFGVESTIYLAPDATGKGIGSRLYGALLAQLRERRLHCVVGVIALPNPGSVALHEKLGFAKIGHLKEIGWKFGRWVDVGHWQLML